MSSLKRPGSQADPSVSQRDATRRKLTTSPLDDAIHDRWVEAVFETCEEEPSNLSLAMLFLATIVSESEGRLDPKYEKTAVAKALLREDSELMKKLSVAWKNRSLKEISNLPVLQNPSQQWRQTRGEPSGSDIMDMTAIASRAATVASWNTDFVGTADEALIDTLDSYITENDDRYYARFLSIVQSSGMGKSRMIDQVAKRKIVLSLNLRENRDGYPPADEAIKNYFFEANLDSLDAYSKHFTAFFISLFNNLAEIIEGPPRMDAPGLRDWLSVGSNFATPGTNRVAFYSKVTADARETSTKLERLTPPIPMDNTSQSPSQEWRFRRQEIRDPASGSQEHSDSVVNLFEQWDSLLSLEEAAKNVLTLIKLEENSPLQLLIAFDEAEQLAEPIEGVIWTRLSALQKVLRQLRDFNIFACALATTGKIRRFTPPPGSASSSRLQQGFLIYIPPFAALGFDQLALSKEASKGRGLTLSEVTEIKFMASLGRPLFASRYFAEIGAEDQRAVRAAIVGFAAQKLLCTPQALSMTKFVQDEQFALVSTRIPLEFNAVTTFHKNRENEFVEKHMRVCLDVTSGFESVTTVAASEPLLAEAAALLMRRFSPSDAPKFLLEEWASGGLSKGNRGEMATALILLLAGDQARRPRSAKHISVPEFFSALVRPRYASIIMDSSPYKFRTDEENKTFRETFGKSYIWFNHFIRVEDFLVINRKYLWAFITRGCAVVCADNQYGVDIIIPIVFRDRRLEPANTSAIFVQVKNRKHYSTPKHQPFDDLDPWDVGMLSSGDKPLPMIRMLFSVGSDQPTIEVMKAPERRNPPREARAAAAPAGLTTYDIWLGGVSAETLSVVTQDSEAAWRDTLKAARDHRHAVFVTKGQREKTAILTRAQHPLALLHPAHWGFLPEDQRPKEESG